MKTEEIFGKHFSQETRGYFIRNSNRLNKLRKYLISKINPTLITLPGYTNQEITNMVKRISTNTILDKTTLEDQIENSKAIWTIDETTLEIARFGKNVMNMFSSVLDTKLEYEFKDNKGQIHKAKDQKQKIISYFVEEWNNSQNHTVTAKQGWIHDSIKRVLPYTEDYCKFIGLIAQDYITVAINVVSSMGSQHKEVNSEVMKQVGAGLIASHIIRAAEVDVPLIYKTQFKPNKQLPGLYL